MKRTAWKRGERERFGWELYAIAQAVLSRKGFPTKAKTLASLEALVVAYRTGRRTSPAGTSGAEINRVNETRVDCKPGRR